MPENDYAASIKKMMEEGRLRQSSSQGTNAQLAQQIYGNLQETGESPSILERGTNVLGRIFDVVSRPNYAVAETAQSMLEGRNPAAGFIRGLTGHDKTSFTDVLKTAGVENSWGRSLGGFALDIALDPTTYLTGGVIKGATAAEIRTAGAKAAESLKLSGLVEEAGDKVATAAGKDFLNTAKGTMKKAALDKEAQKIAKETKEEFVLDASKAAAQKAQQEVTDREMGRVILKWRNKEIAGSNKLYEAGRKIGIKANEVPILRSINESLRNNAVFVSGLNDIRRRAETVNIARYEQAARRIMSLFNDLTPEQSHILLDSIESGADVTAAGLAEHQKAIKEFFQKTRELELDAGIGNELDEMSNYTYHIFDPDKNSKIALRDWEADYHKAASDNLAKRKKILKETGEDPGPFVNEFTLARARQEYGLSPNMDVRQVIAGRLAKSYAEQGNKLFIDEAIANFGIKYIDKKVAKGLGLVKSEAKGTKDVWFDPEIARSLDRFNEFVSNDEATKGLLKFYDKALAGVKFSQTVVNVGHHIRNLIGDIWLSFLDGVQDPRVYDLAGKIQFRMKNFDDLDDFRHIGDLMQAKYEPSMKLKFGNYELNETETYSKFIESGAKSGFFNQEFGGLGENAAKNIVGKATRKLRKLSEDREDFVRLAHFIDALEKEAVGAKTAIEFDEAVIRAGQRVRKFNFDYGDLTEFERRKLKRIIPFYTWLRKNTPLQIESLALRPGRQVVAPKLINALETGLGTEDWEPQIGPLTVIPAWLKDSSAAAVSRSGNGMFWNPEVIPVMGLNEVLGQGFGPGGAIPDPMNFARYLMSQTTPALRIPVEQVSDFNFFRGSPEDSSNIETFRDLVPIGRLLGGLNNGTLQPQQVSSWLSGISLSRPSDASNRAELRRQEDIVQRIMRDRRANGAQ